MCIYFRCSQSDITPSVSPSCSVISLNSSKSHDGVFLRPDPVARSEYNKCKALSNGVNIPERSATPSPTLGLRFRAVDFCSFHLRSMTRAILPLQVWVAAAATVSLRGW